MDSIVLENVTKQFGDTVVIDQLNLQVRKGERLICSGLQDAENRRFYA